MRAALDLHDPVGAPLVADRAHLPPGFDDRDSADPVRWARAHDLFQAALDLPPDEAVMRKAAALNKTPINVVTPPEQGKWRRENPTEIQKIVPLISPTMERMGYTLDEE